MRFSNLITKMHCVGQKCQSHKLIEGTKMVKQDGEVLGKLILQCTEDECRNIIVQCGYDGLTIKLINMDKYGNEKRNNKKIHNSKRN